MIKPGNRVSLFYDITKEGEVIDVVYVPTNTWLTEGTSSKVAKYKVRWSDGTESIHPFGELMRID